MIESQVIRRGALLAAVFVASVSGTDASAQRKIYLANDNHTDIFWNADLATYEDVFVGTLDYYLGKARETNGEVAGIPAEPPQFQSRYHADGTNWLWTYRQRKTPQEFAALITKIKSGHLSVNMMPHIVTAGGMPTEAFIRGMLFAGQLERDHGLKFELAYVIENQTLPYGLASIFAGSGAKYSWMGICGCETKVPEIFMPRDREIYWWQGADGKRVLMKWYSHSNASSPGGYAEARASVAKPVTGTVGKLQALMDDTARYPYAIAGAFGFGGDDVNEPADHNQFFVETAKSKSTPTLSVIVSNEVDFFRDFEANYGTVIPTFNASFGSEWELRSASVQASTSQLRRSLDTLRNAEALSVLVSRKSATFMDARRAEQRQRWMDIAAYYDHGWTSLTAIYADLKARRLAWTQGLANGVEGYANTLLADASDALARQIKKTGTATRFYVFNALNWARTDVADIPYAGPLPAHVVDLVTNLEVPSQPVTLGGVAHLRVMAPAVPSVGYKVFEIRAGAGSAVFVDTIRVDQAAKVLENERYTVTLGENGDIVSLLDRSRASREFVRAFPELPAGQTTTVNSFGPGVATIEVENAGVVSKTFKIVSPAPLQRTTRITLYRGSDRIDIRNEITQNFDDVREWGFGFNVNAPTVRHDEIGAVLTAKLLGNGGHYSPRQARYDWMMANRFVDVTGGGVGVTLSNPDLSFFKLGDSTVTLLDTTRPLIRMLAGGRPDADLTTNGFVAQGGANYFLQRFALQTHGAYNQTNAMKFALEHQTPFVARVVVGGNQYAATQFTLMKTNTPKVMLTALKVAEDGIGRGVVARVWNSVAGNTPFSFGGSLVAQQELTHIESAKGTPVFPVSLKNQELATYLLR